MKEFVYADYGTSLHIFDNTGCYHRLAILLKTPKEMEERKSD